MSENYYFENVYLVIGTASRGWGENGQSMLKINYRTGEIAAVMTNQNPGVDQTESGLYEMLEML